MRYLGGFVSCAGGLYKAIENGENLGVNTIMMHPSPPQRWNTKPFDPEQIAKFNEAKAKSGIKKVYMHGIYLINLANPDKQKFHLSKISLVYYLDLLSKIDADGVIFHTGSFKDIEENAGYERVIYGLNWIMEHLESEFEGKKLFLECAAGAGSIIGDKFEELGRIYEGVKYKEKIGFCLDTQHMFASGYDIVNNLDGVVDQIDKNLGIENVHAIHFNDSKTELASNRDRHENLGEGLIGEKAMTAFLNHPKLKDVSFVLETPGMGDPDLAPKEIGKLHKWAK